MKCSYHLPYDSVREKYTLILGRQKYYLVHCSVPSVVSILCHMFVEPNSGPHNLGMWKTQARNLSARTEIIF